MFITARATAEAMATIMESIFKSINLCAFLCFARSEISAGSGRWLVPYLRTEIGAATDVQRHYTERRERSVWI